MCEMEICATNAARANAMQCNAAPCGYRKILGLGYPKVSRRVKFTPPETCNFEWILYDRIYRIIYAGYTRVIIRCISDYVNYSMIKCEKVARWGT